MLKIQQLEILARDGWDNITAVKNGDVYYIDANSARGNQNILKALDQIG